MTFCISLVQAYRQADEVQLATDVLMVLFFSPTVQFTMHASCLAGVPTPSLGYLKLNFECLQYFQER